MPVLQLAPAFRSMSRAHLGERAVQHAYLSTSKLLTQKPWHGAPRRSKEQQRSSWASSAMTELGEEPFGINAKNTQVTI